MDKKVKGSWLIHHTDKLQSVRSQSGFEKTYLSGKSGILLSAISSNNEITISNQRLDTLAQASNINVLTELPIIIDLLKKKELIDVAGNGIAILGVTTSSALQHTSDIFDSLQPTSQENAAIGLAERASLEPIKSSEALEELADAYSLNRAEITEVLFNSEQIGFVDVENLGGSEKLLFNGNLFRRETAKKVKAVLDSLSSDEQSKLTEANGIIRKQACVPLEIIKNILGDKLFSKVSEIGLFDINVVSNSIENVGFITLPSAFSKFSSNSMVDDPFDLAKAFISSITYGMTKSSYERGQIQMVDKLLSTLVRGESIGPVAAIGEDYKILEKKGVVQVEIGSKRSRSGNIRTGLMMKLLKKEVGELALQAIRQGDVSERSLNLLPNVAVTNFSGPEYNREIIRRKQREVSPRATNDMLSALRGGRGL
jgi:hypothetical protein